MPSRSSKRPRDPNQLAKLVVDIATGEVVDDHVPARPKNPAAVALGQLGELGPVDPQIRLVEDGVTKWFSAHSLVNGYDKLFQEAVTGAGRIEPYIQQLGNYDDRMINRYRSFIDLSNDMAIKVLSSGMLQGTSDNDIKTRIEVFLKPEAGTHSHGRPIYAMEAKACDLRIEDMDVNSSLWKTIYELYVRTDRYVSRAAAKAVESRGESFFVAAPAEEWP